ncbi:uncharacterized protein DNG_08893 [Cephalotrichum gorgonifer]|uniref:Uncharacterized protein n=1 Tax=Cephalotrichum gorgonifer TaxID=2041049 RepID=A0AAE8N5W6_9PEZI|nr:uncharacterized protein DNG_08893 [Cephalotrichum gorgonifer]
MTTSTSISTLIVSGTPLTFIPVMSTPWPQPSDCAVTWRRGDLTVMAHDVIYGMSFASEVQTCWPPDFTSSWAQAHIAETYSVFGPTFQCPEAYHAVQTAIVGEDVNRVFCCPSSYSLNIPQPISYAWPSQCTSIATSGQVITYLGSHHSSDGGVTNRIVSSTVGKDEVTLYGIPVNGFNVAVSISTPTASPSDTNENSREEDQPSDTGTPAGVIAGAVVGAIGGLALIVLGAWLLWRRRRSARANRGSAAPDPFGGIAPGQAGGGAYVGGKPYAELSTASQETGASKSA